MSLQGYEALILTIQCWTYHQIDAQVQMEYNASSENPMTDRNRVKGAHTTRFAIYPNRYLQDDGTYIRILIKHVPIRGFHYATGQEYTVKYGRKYI